MEDLTCSLVKIQITKSSGKKSIIVYVPEKPLTEERVMTYEALVILVCG
jgi:hypothetical protein